jgi:hypothetical protein
MKEQIEIMIRTAASCSSVSEDTTSCLVKYMTALNSDGTRAF